MSLDYGSIGLTPQLFSVNSPLNRGTSPFVTAQDFDFNYETVPVSKIPATFKLLKDGVFSGTCSANTTGTTVGFQHFLGVGNHPFYPTVLAYQILPTDPISFRPLPATQVDSVGHVTEIFSYLVDPVNFNLTIAVGTGSPTFSSPTVVAVRYFLYREVLGTHVT